jgi:hypothetical protein
VGPTRTNVTAIFLSPFEIAIFLIGSEYSPWEFLVPVRIFAIAIFAIAIAVAITISRFGISLIGIFLSPFRTGICGWWVDGWIVGRNRIYPSARSDALARPFLVEKTSATRWDQKCSL